MVTLKNQPFAWIVLFCGCTCISVSSFLLRPTTRVPQSEGREGNSVFPLFSTYGQNDHVLEAIQSLVDFHEGTWKGTARSFTVTQDTAAGIVKRKQAPEYQVSVKLGANSADRDYSLTETFGWDDKLSARSLSLNQCNVDVDSVDASYSLDSSLPDFPSQISGTDELCSFVIEHCIAAADDRRVRCFILYGVDQSLQRVVVCEETREKEAAPTIPSSNEAEGNPNQPTTQDLFEMESDIDRLVDKITRSNDVEGKRPTIDVTPSPDTTSFGKLDESMSSSDGAQQLSLHDISLLELSSGVWLGDAIIRDLEMIPESPIERGQGFGESSAKKTFPSPVATFGSWSVGVQKVAWRTMWNFGEEIRNVVDVGKGMGAKVADCMTKSLSGSVCVNEGLKRRMPKSERMVYTDWTGDIVGFLVGPFSIQVPRYLNFDRTSTKKQLKPFFTEFGLYQEAEQPKSNRDGNAGDEVSLPELCCSKISRVYNFEGKLKQGCTSFYKFDRFGMDEMD